MQVSFIFQGLLIRKVSLYAAPRVGERVTFDWQTGYIVDRTVWNLETEDPRLEVYLCEASCDEPSGYDLEDGGDTRRYSGSREDSGRAWDELDRKASGGGQRYSGSTYEVDSLEQRMLRACVTKEQASDMADAGIGVRILDDLKMMEELERLRRDVFDSCCAGEYQDYVDAVWANERSYTDQPIESDQVSPGEPSKDSEHE